MVERLEPIPPTSAYQLSSIQGPPIWTKFLAPDFNLTPRYFLQVLRFSSGYFGFPPGTAVFLRVNRFSSGYSGFPPGTPVFLFQQNKASRQILAVCPVINPFSPSQLTTPNFSLHYTYKIRNLVMRTCELIKQNKLLKIKSKIPSNLFNEKYGHKLREFNNTTGTERVNIDCFHY